MAEEKTYAFNIESGDLSKALIQFSELTSQQLFFDSALTRAHRGHAVQGDFTIMEGLLILLQGTGLNAHVSGGGISLSQSMPVPGHDDDRAQAAAPSEKVVNLNVLSIESTSLTIESHDYLTYAGYVAAQVRSAVQMNKHLESARYDVSARIWIDPGGHVVRVQLPAQSGDDDIDKEIALTLDHLAVNAPPPLHMLAVSVRIQSATP